MVRLMKAARRYIAYRYPAEMDAWTVTCGNVKMNSRLTRHKKRTRAEQLRETLEDGSTATGRGVKGASGALSRPLVSSQLIKSNVPYGLIPCPTLDISSARLHAC